LSKVYRNFLKGLGRETEFKCLVLGLNKTSSGFGISKMFLAGVIELPFSQQVR
jgi:hypothetical protein